MTNVPNYCSYVFRMKYLHFLPNDLGSPGIMVGVEGGGERGGGGEGEVEGGGRGGGGGGWSPVRITFTEL